MSNCNLSTIHITASIAPFRLTSLSGASRRGKTSFIMVIIVISGFNSTDAAKQRALICLTAEYGWIRSLEKIGNNSRS